MSNKVNKIKEQRKTLAYSVRELAALTNIKEKDIVDYEANKKIATLKTLEKIAKVTSTNVSDWVDEDYFIKSKHIENILDKDNEDIAVCFFRALFRADDVMETLYTALIDMKEIEREKNKEIVFSEFSKELIKGITSIKLKKVFEVCKNKDIKESITNEICTERSYTHTEKKKPSLDKVTLNGLLYELKILFKGTDIVDVIIQALISTGYIKSNGECSEKATLLLKTIMSNKIKSSLIKKGIKIKRGNK